MGMLSMLVEWEIQYFKDAHSPKIDLYIQCNPIKYSIYFLLVEIDKPIPKFI